MVLLGSSPDWQRLFIQGRCKAVGTPWSAEEKEMIKNATNKTLEIARIRKESGVKHNFEQEVDKKTEKAQLEEKVKIMEKVMASHSVDIENKGDETVSTVVERVDEKIELSLSELQIRYKEKIGDLPMRYKNNPDWLKSKLL